MKARKCRWNCGRLTDRRGGVCLQCCNERDERDKRISAGIEAYVPPDKRPGHRLYKGDKPKRRLSDSQRQALTQARTAKSLKQTHGKAPCSEDEAVDMSQPKSRNPGPQQHPAPLP